MYQHLFGLRNRVTRLERRTGATQVTFILEGGARAGIRRRDLLDAMTEAIEGKPTFRAKTMLHAVSASDGSKLHELARSLALGPALTPKRNTSSETEEE